MKDTDILHIKIIGDYMKKTNKTLSELIFEFNSYHKLRRVILIGEDEEIQHISLPEGITFNDILEGKR